MTPSLSFPCFDVARPEQLITEWEEGDDDDGRAEAAQLFGGEE